MVINKVADILKSGGVVVILTDTLYGLVGQALNKKTVSRIYKIKGRKNSKPFIILISSIDDLSFFKINVSRKLRLCLSKFWPGPTSIILPCKNPENKYLHRGTRTLAFRLPKNKFLVRLLRETGPLVAPSANPENFLPAKNVQIARKYFGPQVDLYVKGGRPKMKASSLIKIKRQGKIEIIRK